MDSKPPSIPSFISSPFYDTGSNANSNSSFSNPLSSINVNKLSTTRIMDSVRSNPMLKYIIYIVLMIVSTIIVIHLIIKLYNIYINIKQKNPWLMYGTKAAKKYQYIIQDKIENPFQLIKPSSNRPGGLEFSYGCWIFIDDFKYRAGEWKHIFHKGSSAEIADPENSSQRASQCPGVWMGKDTNTLHVFVNTFSTDKDKEDTIKDDEVYNDSHNTLVEGTTVKNIPINNWVNIVVAVRQYNLDIYINGVLAKRKLLKNLPKQNYGKFHINSNGGFSGFISNIRYFSYYITYGELYKYVRSGPSSIPPRNAVSKPPYLSERWWISQ
jgi:hypothetical protein